MYQVGILFYFIDFLLLEKTNESRSCHAIFLEVRVYFRDRLRAAVRKCGGGAAGRLGGREHEVLQREQVALPEGGPLRSAAACGPGGL